MKKREPAIVAVSGGLDSCVTLAIAAEKYKVAVMHANYGQRTEKKELKAFEALAAHYDVDLKQSFDLRYLANIKGSSLTDYSLEIEKGAPGDGIPSTYVPFRNANILAVCVAWAEVIGAGRIFIGAVQEDSSGYPDCREEFFSAFEKAANLGTKPDFKIKIETPIIHMRKSEIIKTGHELNAPFHLTWSCYGEEELACGECESCYIRLRGFKEAGLDDPIPYRKRVG